MAPTTAATRARPFILVTGVPGAGKTTLADALATRIDAKSIDGGALCAREGFHGAYVEDADTHELDEDALLDRMEDLLEGHAARGEACVVDYHSCELFPERWFDLVTCLTLVDDTATLYDRLAARGYSEKKIRENVECDIFQVVVEEAKEAYEEVWVRANADADAMEATVEEIAARFESRQISGEK